MTIVAPPPDLLTETLKLTGGQKHLAEIIEATPTAIRYWINQGYSIEKAARIYFCLRKYRERIDTLIKEWDAIIEDRITRPGYHFPPTGTRHY